MQEDNVPYRELLEQAVDLIQSVTPDGRFLYVNPAWQCAFGYSREEAARLSLFDLVHPEYRAEYRELLQRVAGGKKVDRFETVFLTRDRRSLTVEGSCACSFQGEAPEAILSIFRDISERKRAEEVLARQAAELSRVNETMEEKDRELADTLEQARKYREAQERARELSVINEELKAEIAGRRRAERRIRASLKEKEVLLKEIHHRVKNNLQIISSLLNLQSEHIDDLQAIDMFREGQGRIRTMALIHEKLYQSGDLARVDFSEYVRSLASYLIRSYSATEVNLKVDVEDVSLGLDTAIPCGLIINELVSNAFKYAFPEGRKGKIDVILRRDTAGRTTLIVKDDGVGFPKEMDFRNTESLGLQLVMTLVDQLEGDIEQGCREGAEFRITFT